MRPALYARVSDDKKKEDGQRRQEVERQMELLREHMRKLDVTEWDEFVDDGKSGWSDDLNSRPDFKRCKREDRTVEAIVIVTPALLRHFSLASTPVYTVNIANSSLMVGGLS